MRFIIVAAIWIPTCLLAWSLEDRLRSRYGTERANLIIVSILGAGAILLIGMAWISALLDIFLALR